MIPYANMAEEGEHFSYLYDIQNYLIVNNVNNGDVREIIRSRQFYLLPNIIDAAPCKRMLRKCKYNITWANAERLIYIYLRSRRILHSASSIDNSRTAKKAKSAIKDMQDVNTYFMQLTGTDIDTFLLYNNPDL